MVIKASSAAEIRQLIDALAGGDEVRREAAIARLAIIGSRAIDRLGAAYAGTGDRATRIAILRAMESMGDVRTVALARQALAEGGDLSVAAVSVLRGLLDCPHAPAATESLDTLVSVALDPSAEHRVRLAAFEALQDVPGGVRDRVAEALRADPDPALNAQADEASKEVAGIDAVWQDALEGRLPDRPSALREALQLRGSSAALSTLQKLVDATRAREGSLGRADERDQWRSLRGAIHQALALRGSRVAVYDLRESLETARAPLPVSFLAALHVVGDESCLEALAAAHAHTADERWRHQLGEAFRAIARRERLTRRSAAIKRIAGRWPDAVRELLQ